MPEKKRRPNVVVVLTDDQGYGDLGCHGNTVIRTPNINKIHADAVRFVDFHVGTTCAPTRAGLLTGRYCNSVGVWHTIGGRSLLRDDEWTLADALRQAGYRTGHFGKWLLGDSQQFLPHERGFETTLYHGGGAIGSTPDYWGNDYFDDTFFANGVPRKFEGYCTDVFFREALSFIEEHANEKFFCYIAPNAPHTPLNVESSYWEPYRNTTPHEDRALFYGMISNIDDNTGKLQTQLEQLGIAEDTITVFMTDNGSASGIEVDDQEFPQEGPGSHNAGMRGKKGSPYEGGHRIPFLLRYPAVGMIGGRDVDVLTSYVDFMPTILDLCGVEVLNGRSFHGRSLVPLATGQAGVEWNDRIIVTDTQRIARPVKWRQSCVMRNRWRLVNGRELYDLATDPGERDDVADRHPEIVRDLREGYEAWWLLVNEQLERDVPIAIGGDADSTRLTTHDIRNEACDAAWNQGQVRSAHVVSGYWAVDVKREGTYKIVLRRWPSETGHAIASGIKGDDVEWRRDWIQEKNHHHYTGGVALDIRWAGLTIGGTTQHREVEAGATSVIFTVDLEAGVDRLYAAFYDGRERTIAPYYVTVMWTSPIQRGRMANG
jgi:arylsulfatase A-like enzyme